eukprot:5293746-Pleurochrysis_carterae.AAC.3
MRPQPPGQNARARSCTHGKPTASSEALMEARPPHDRPCLPPSLQSPDLQSPTPPIGRPCFPAPSAQQPATRVLLQCALLGMLRPYSPAFHALTSEKPTQCPSSRKATGFSTHFLEGLVGHCI